MSGENGCAREGVCPLGGLVTIDRSHLRPESHISGGRSESRAGRLSGQNLGFVIWPKNSKKGEK